MKMLEDGRAAQNWTSGGDPGAGPEAPAPQAPRPRRRDPPLTVYGGAQDLYDAMAAARRANLAKLADETSPAGALIAQDREGGARILGWALLAAAASVALWKGLLRRK
jgi:hypothetical protein